jgi:hypothetical protein
VITCLTGAAPRRLRHTDQAPGLCPVLTNSITSPSHDNFVSIGLGPLPTMSAASAIALGIGTEEEEVTLADVV